MYKACLTAKTFRRISESLLQRDSSFLLFRAGPGALKVLPLDFVTRLEEIETSRIEIAGDQHVIQYNKDLMTLVKLEKFELPKKPITQVIVFNYNNKNIGLIVDNIIDIAESPYNIKLPSKDKLYAGSMLVDGKVTDIINVENLLSEFTDTNVDALVEPPKKITNNKKSKPSENNLLLVEDSPFIRKLSEVMLNSAGYKVVSVENCKEALELIIQKPNHFQIIVTDIETPLMNGFELAIECRKIYSDLELPIIANTASIDEEVLRCAKASGMNHCILKDDKTMLLKTISNLLGSSNEVLE